jgi:hypothetical protein
VPCEIDPWRYIDEATSSTATSATVCASGIIVKRRMFTKDARRQAPIWARLRGLYASIVRRSRRKACTTRTPDSPSCSAVSVSATRSRIAW